MVQVESRFPLTTQNPKMRKIYDSLFSIARSNANVIIFGESGTGKEVLARQIHALSAGAVKEMVSINCAAIPEGLLESELFGFKKGSFTGALTDSKGLFEAAADSTLFLDEIGDLPTSLQAKLLRVLQERKVRAIGETKEKTLHFRLISATHRNLKRHLSEGSFREDLFYRLSVVPIQIPALRERPEDLPILIARFRSSFAEKYGQRPLAFTARALAKLASYHWPGNIRELANVIERLAVMYRGEVDASDIHLGEDVEKEIHDRFNFDADQQMPTMEEMSTEYIRYVLSRVGRQEKAARILGLSRRTIYRKLHGCGGTDLRIKRQSYAP